MQAICVFLEFSRVRAHKHYQNTNQTHSVIWALDSRCYFNSFTDIDECDEDEDICGEHGQCQNIPGSYTCSCLHPTLWNPVTQKCEGNQIIILKIFVILEKSHN